MGLFSKLSISLLWVMNVKFVSECVDARIIILATEMSTKLLRNCAKTQSWIRARVFMYEPMMMQRSANPLLIAAPGSYGKILNGEVNVNLLISFERRAAYSMHRSYTYAMQNFVRYCVIMITLYVISQFNFTFPFFRKIWGQIWKTETNFAQHLLI